MLGNSRATTKGWGLALLFPGSPQRIHNRRRRRMSGSVRVRSPQCPPLLGFDSDGPHRPERGAAPTCSCRNRLTLNVTRAGQVLRTYVGTLLALVRWLSSMVQTIACQFQHDGFLCLLLVPFPERARRRRKSGCRFTYAVLASGGPLLQTSRRLSGIGLLGRSRGQLRGVGSSRSILEEAGSVDADVLGGLMAAKCRSTLVVRTVVRMVSL